MAVLCRRASRSRSSHGHASHRSASRGGASHCGASLVVPRIGVHSVDVPLICVHLVDLARIGVPLIDVPLMAYIDGFKLFLRWIITFSRGDDSRSHCCSPLLASETLPMDGTGMTMTDTMTGT